MLLLPIRTPLIRPGDDLATIVAASAREQHAPGIQGGDIVVFSSKVVAAAEGHIVHLPRMTPSKKACELSLACGKTPQFCEAVLRELGRMHGRVLRTCPGAMLTEVRPEGLMEGTILVANAGLDDSNAPLGHAVGWPRDPVASVMKLRKNLESHLKLQVTGFWFFVRKYFSSKRKTRNYKRETLRPHIAVAISDSCVHPQRLGVSAFALTVSGFDPTWSRIGEHDLFDREMKITQEATADQLATAANMIMGNVAESTPAVIARDHGIPFTDFEGWIPGMRAEEDLFGEIK